MNEKQSKSALRVTTNRLIVNIRNTDSESWIVIVSQDEVKISRQTVLFLNTWNILK